MVAIVKGAVSSTQQDQVGKLNGAVVASSIPDTKRHRLGNKKRSATNAKSWSSSLILMFHCSSYSQCPVLVLLKPSQQAVIRQGRKKELSVFDCSICFQEVLSSRMTYQGGRSSYSFLTSSFILLCITRFIIVTKL